MAELLYWGGWGLWICSFGFFILRKVDGRRHDLLMAISWLLICAGEAIRHRQGSASIDAAFAGFYLWHWWTNGGDDDTKRRLRKLAKKFQGRRRTAPATA
jgi:hypothetical protein